MAKNYKGARFGKLVMIARVAPGGKGKGAIWAAHCDCGNVVEREGKTIAAGRLKSCGNCRKQLGKQLNVGPRASRETAFHRKKYVGAVRKAAREGIKWDLTPEQYSEITNNKCSMCGTPPDKYTSVVSYDPAQGYTPSVCRSICTTCKHLVGTNNPVLFLQQVVTIYRNINN